MPARKTVHKLAVAGAALAALLGAFFVWPRPIDVRVDANETERFRWFGVPDSTRLPIHAFRKEPPVQDDEIRLLAFGDMMLARGVETAIRKQDAASLFAGVQPLFSGNDVVTANAEGVFVDVPETQKPDSPDDLHFPFEPALLPVLKQIGFTHLGVANNHSLNFGQPALKASRGLMRDAGLEPFGDPANASDLVSFTDVRGRKIAQIGYHHFGGTGPEKVLQAITEAKAQHAFVIVYPHWGIEYAPKPSRSQIDLAHRFIDAGADVVLGAHPHVIQPIETYHGKAIFYSLGNFIFDQSFSQATSQGLAVEIVDAGGETAFRLTPFAIRDGAASLMSSEARAIVLRTLSERSSVSDDVATGIADGFFTLKP